MVLFSHATNIFFVKSIITRIELILNKLKIILSDGKALVTIFFIFRG